MKDICNKLDNNNLSQVDVEHTHKIIHNVAEFEYQVDSDKMEIDEMIYIPEELSKYLVVDQVKEPDHGLK
jgi:hypothetical protein